VDLGPQPGIADQLARPREALDRADGGQDRHRPDQADARHLEEIGQALIDRDLVVDHGLEALDLGLTLIDQVQIELDLQLLDR
jgi:hypothetical protein